MPNAWSQCSNPVRFLKAPIPTPTAAYPMQFYPATGDFESAEVVEILPGEEKSGLDFRMRPVPVAHIHGTLASGDADWHGRNDLQVQLVPLDQRGADAMRFHPTRIDTNKGTFEIDQVFPGSYRLVVVSQTFVLQTGFGRRNIPASGEQMEPSDRIGAVMHVDAGDKPIELSLALRRAVDVSGTIEIERGNDTNNQVTLSELSLELTSDYFFGGPPPAAQVKDDGSFTIKSVLPGEWRIVLHGPFAFLKSAWLGAEDVTNRMLDLTSGAAGSLRILASTNTATIRGRAPAGMMVFTRRDEESPGWNSNVFVDANGQFTLSGLAPGKYRVSLGENGDSFPSEGGQEVTLREGETATIELRSGTKP